MNLNIFEFNLIEEEQDWLIIDPASEVCWEAGMSAETWLLTELVHLVLFFALLYTNMHKCMHAHTHAHTHKHRYKYRHTTVIFKAQTITPHSSKGNKTRKPRAEEVLDLIS